MKAAWSWRLFLVVAGACALFAALAAPTLWRPFTSLPDDSYFYLQVAWNIARGEGSTFHGLTPTNGYHPLWMALCVLGFILGHGDKILAARWIVGMQQALAVGAVALLYRAARDLIPRGAILAASVAAVYLFTGMFGSEAHLNAFCCALMLWLVVRLWHRPKRRAVDLAVIGLSAGFCILARLDNVFVVGMLLAGAWLSPVSGEGQTGGARWLREGLWLAAPTAIPVLLYLGLNMAWYGHAVPISGALKSTFPQAVWRPEAMGMLGRMVAGIALVASTVAVLWRGRSGPGRILFWLAAGVLLHTLWLATFTRGFIKWSWYHVPGVFLTALVLAAAAEWLFHVGRARTVRVGVWTGVTLLMAFAVARAWIKSVNPDAIDYRNPIRIHARRAEQGWPMELADWLRDRLPPGSGVSMWDLPGASGYFSGLTILPADGLMNDYGYNDDVLAEGVASYWASRGVRYWVGPLADERPRHRRDTWTVTREPGAHLVEVFAPLYRHRSAGVVRLPDSCLLADLRRELRHPDSPAVGVWRIPDEPAEGPDEP